MHWLILLLYFQLTAASNEVLRLQSPRNTSVQAGGTARLKCALLIAKSQIGRSEERLTFVPWRNLPTQQISVQWTIDGFGYTLETLLDSFSGRYIMPGPIDEGNC